MVLSCIEDLLVNLHSDVKRGQNIEAKAEDKTLMPRLRPEPQGQGRGHM